MMKRALPRLDWRFLLRSLALFLGYWCLFLFLNTASDLTDLEVLSVMALLVSGIALTWLLVGQCIRFPLNRPVLIFLTAYLITSLVSSDPRRSLSELCFILFAIFLLVLSAELVARGWPVLQMVFLWMISGGVIALLMWQQVFDWHQRWNAVAEGNPFPSLVFRLPSENTMAYFLNPFILMSVAFMLIGRSWFQRIAWGGISVFFGILSYLASSRAAWLGLAAGLVFLFFWFLRQYRPNWHAAWRWLRARSTFLALVCLIGLIALAGGAWLLYQQTIHPTHAPIADARTEYWPPAWQAFLNSPIIGHGPYTFGSIWLETYSVPPKGFYPHAHSTLFNLLAEGGLVLALAVLWLVAYTVHYLWKRLREMHGLHGMLVATSLAGTLAFITQSFFDCFYPNPLGLWAMLLLLGLVIGISEPPQPIQAGRTRRPFAVLLLVASLWFNIWLLEPLVRGQRLADTGQWQEAAEFLQQAAERDPWLSVAWTNAGVAQTNLGRLDLAAQNFEKAIKLDPQWSLNWANLGAVYLAQENTTDARKAFERATNQEPGVAEFWLGLGLVAEAQGDEPSARAAYSRALDLRPDWSEAYFWRVSELRQDVKQTWGQSVGNPGTVSIGQLEAVVMASPSAAKGYINLGAAYLHAGRIHDAQRVLNIAQMAFFSQSRDGLELMWLNAELAAGQGDLALAVKHGQNALTNLMAPGLLGPGASGGVLYFTGSYRRPSMFTDFVPQYPLIVVTDTWGARMVQLSQWYAALGDTARAKEVLDMAVQQIPDLKLP